MPLLGDGVIKIGVISLLPGGVIMGVALSPVTKLIVATENAIIKKRENTSMFFL